MKRGNTEANGIVKKTVLPTAFLSSCCDSWDVSKRLAKKKLLAILKNSNPTLLCAIRLALHSSLDSTST
jgi:uncharacterized ParB-like nuclease family protein